MKRAFTLIEFIVVIAILLILAAILFPVVMRPHEGNPRRSRCQSNLKQIGLGFVQYVQDYDGRFPPARVTSAVGWADVLQPYVKSRQIFQCPSTPNSSTTLTDYFYNQRLARVNTEKISEIALTVLGGDGTDEAPTWNSVPQLPSAWTATPESPARRHLDGADYLFADGHVKWKEPTKIKTTLPVQGSDVAFAIR